MASSGSKAHHMLPGTSSEGLRRRRPSSLEPGEKPAMHKCDPNGYARSEQLGRAKFRPKPILLQTCSRRKLEEDQRVRRRLGDLAQVSRASTSSSCGAAGVKPLRLPGFATIMRGATGGSTITTEARQIAAGLGGRDVWTMRDRATTPPISSRA
jgi:hypothetical protein